MTTGVVKPSFCGEDGLFQLFSAASAARWADHYQGQRRNASHDWWPAICAPATPRALRDVSSASNRSAQTFTVIDGLKTCRSLGLLKGEA